MYAIRSLMSSPQEQNAYTKEHCTMCSMKKIVSVLVFILLHASMASANQTTQVFENKCVRYGPLLALPASKSDVYKIISINLPNPIEIRHNSSLFKVDLSKPAEICKETTLRPNIFSGSTQASYLNILGLKSPYFNTVDEGEKMFAAVMDCDVLNYQARLLTQEDVLKKMEAEGCANIAPQNKNICEYLESRRNGAFSNGKGPIRVGYSTDENPNTCSVIEKQCGIKFDPQRLPEVCKKKLDTTNPNECLGKGGVMTAGKCECSQDKQYDSSQDKCVLKPKNKEDCIKIPNSIWHDGDEATYQAGYCQTCGANTTADQESRTCKPVSGGITEAQCKNTANASWDGNTKRCSCVNGREPISDQQGRVSCEIRNPPTPGQTCEQTYNADMISDGQGSCKCKTDGHIWNAQEKKCKPPAGWTQTPPPSQAGRECTKDGRTGKFDNDGNCVINITSCFSSSMCGEGRRCEDGQCKSICQSGEVFQNGRCAQAQQECPQGQIRQNGQCVPQQQQCQQGQVMQNGQCVPQQQQCKQDEEMIQGRCFPKKPNAQQPKEQPKQQQQQGPTPQQQQQMQQLQAMQECQMRQPQGAWQWNGFQCLPNPNYNPQGYGAQPSVTGGVVCNFFGSDAIEVPAGEQFSVTYDVTGAKREIKVDTSPKSTTKYDRQAPTTQANTNTVLNQFGYPQNGTGAAVQTSQQGQATITAPKKKGKLKVSLIVDAVRQNSEACKPIQVTIVDAVPQQSAYDSGNTSNYDSGAQYASNTQPQDTGPTIETPSEIIAQNRRVVSSQPAQQAPEDDDAYAYLCKTLGIGCAKDAPQVDTGPSIRDLQAGNGTQQQGTTREITIDPNAEDPADLPNIGELPGDNGETTRGGQQLATDVGIDGDNKKAYSTVLNYLGENGQYAPPIGPNADTSGVLNSSDAEPTAQTEDRIGIFTRLWRWFLDLLGFGPEYVAA
jgi:hypothetical protein